MVEETGIHDEVIATLALIAVVASILAPLVEAQGALTVRTSLPFGPALAFPALIVFGLMPYLPLARGGAAGRAVIKTPVIRTPVIRTPVIRTLGRWRACRDAAR
ncbi:MAG: hypothetical protein AAF577_00225 [Pseudomonadota bacterium]